jgi:hypothetical protein
MPPAVIARVNLLGKAEPSILTFTDWHGQEIGDYPGDPEPVEDDDASIVDHFDDGLPMVDAQNKSQEWSQSLLLSPQEWRWTLPMTPPKKPTLMMDPDNKMRRYLQSR